MRPLAAWVAIARERMRAKALATCARATPPRRATDALLAAHGIAVRIASEFDNIETIKRVVENGAGLAFVPEITVRREIRDGTLIARPLAGKIIERPTGLILRRGRLQPRAVERFVQVLTSVESSADLQV